MSGDVRTKVYPIPGAAGGAIGEYRTEEELKLLDDFQDSGYLDRYHDAVLTGDRSAFDSLIADQAIYVAERFGKGQRHRKSDHLATFGAKKVVDVKEHTREDVRLVPVGDSTVMMTGVSRSVFSWQGQVSRGPRIFAQAYMKLDGRWQCFIHSIMDFDGEMM